MPSSDRLVAIAAHGLAGSRTDLPSVPLSDIEWFDLVQACLAAELVGFLAAAAAEGHLPTTLGQADELAAIQAEAAGLSLVVERRAATMASLLAASAIDHRVVDGPARRIAYGDSGIRHFRSVRLLVVPSRHPDALALLGPPPLPVGGRPIERRERLAVLAELPGLALAADAGGHSASAEGAPGGAGAAATAGESKQLEPGAVVQLADRPVRVLSLEQQLVATCVDVCASPVSTPLDVRDVAELALSPGLDALGARRLAEANQVTPALAEGVALAWHAFDLADKTELSVWALRMGNRRPAATAVRPIAPAARLGLAQRMFGRAQAPSPASAPLAGQAVPAPVTSVPARVTRPAGSTRR